MSVNSIDTICALSTVEGRGAIAVIRVSGPESIQIVDKIFKPIKGEPFDQTKSYSLRYGTVMDGDRVIDQVLVSVFRSPNSYTGEDMVEISCHGSNYIQQEIVSLLLNNGAKLAKAGEFSQRSFLNGKMDLAQAEAVADLIMAETASAHRVALMQMKGGFSNELSKMREALLEVVSLMELELDFSEEDVEFADRKRLRELVDGVYAHVSSLADSFKLGNVIKNGIPVAIAGATNTGKSTLLNILLQEERAIVSDIHGTTRDFIEGFMNIDGVGFRFIDTAGIRETKETIEIIGIERSFEKIKSASIVLLMLDSERADLFEQGVNQLAQVIDRENQQVIILVNKIDRIEELLYEKNISPTTVYGTAYDAINDPIESRYAKKIVDDFVAEIESLCKEHKIEPKGIIPISAKGLIGIEQLKKTIFDSRGGNLDNPHSTMVTNLRHYQALKDAKESLERVTEGLDMNISTELISQDIREAMYHIGSIVGEINTEEILGNIFSKFCIGK